jgi:hypothetical protein
MSTTSPIGAVVCALCSGSVVPTEMVSLELPLSDGGSQGLYVHWSCLRNALHPTVPLSDVDSYGGPGK